MEEEFIETNISYEFEHTGDLELMRKNSFTERIQPPEMPPHFEIIFKFSRVKTTSDWVTSRGFEGPQLIRSIETAPRKAKSMVRFDLQTFFSHKTVLGKIRRKLRRWVPDKCWGAYLCEHSFYHAVEFMVLMPQSHNVVFIDLSIAVDHQRIFHEDRWLDFVARTSLEEKRFMIPALDSSIESLEKRKADSDGNCVICAEDYSSGFEAMFMPCSHCFHEDCIKEWLRVSRYCPICHFEMPKDDSSEESSLD